MLREEQSLSHQACLCSLSIRSRCQGQPCLSAEVLTPRTVTIPAPLPKPQAGPLSHRTAVDALRLAPGALAA